MTENGRLAAGNVDGPVTDLSPPASSPCFRQGIETCSQPPRLPDVSLASRGRALQEGRWSLDVRNIRDAATDRHRTVDDHPAGGGAGMVLKPDVLAQAIDDTPASGPPPADEPAREAPDAGEGARTARRVRAASSSAAASKGWTSASSPPAVSRKSRSATTSSRAASLQRLSCSMPLSACCPASWACGASGEEESFEDGLLEHPHYTKPNSWEGLDIPEDSPVRRSQGHGPLEAPAARGIDASRAGRTCGRNIRPKRIDLSGLCGYSPANTEGLPA